MKVIILFCLQAIIMNNVWSMSLDNSPILSRPGLNNMPNAFANGAVIANEPIINANLATSAILTNEATTNMLANTNSVLTNDVIGNAVITSANFVPLANMPSNFPMSPMISEIVPSLQYGDVTMSGDLPIGGTIKVCGCFPVYGMISVDGSVPSAGTAVVADSLGNVGDVIAKCANQAVL